MGFRFRLLPLVIFVAAAMLTVKVGGIFDGIGAALESSIAVSPVRAQQAPPRTAPAAQPPAAQPGAAQPGSVTLPPGAGAPAAERPSAALDDPTLLTQAEIDLLQQLADRRQALNSQAADVESRLALLRAAETRMDRKVAELKELQTAIEALVKTHKTQTDARLASLVKIYENMRPKDAARIFQEMTIDVLLPVAERMNERKLAPIMAQMNPEKAKEVTEELSRSRQLPAFSQGVNG
jgi:flagellar motility protein MotE (MotC chaperone)